MPVEFPPHLLELLHRLCESGTKFIEVYDTNRKRMQDIASELEEISKEVKNIQTEANTARILGVVLAGCGMLGLAAGLLATGSSASEGGGRLALIGGTLAIGGGTAIVTANVSKALVETVSMDTVTYLVKEFRTATELQKDDLDKIRQASEELEEKSSSLMTRTRTRAANLLNSEQLEELLRQMAELTERTREVMKVMINMTKGVRELLRFIASIAQVIPNSEQDAQLRHCITNTAAQCVKTVDEFDKLKDSLMDFDKMRTNKLK